MGDDMFTLPSQHPTSPQAFEPVLPDDVNRMILEKAWCRYPDGRISNPDRPKGSEKQDTRDDAELGAYINKLITKNNLKFKIEPEPKSSSSSHDSVHSDPFGSTYNESY